MLERGLCFDDLAETEASVISWNITMQTHFDTMLLQFLCHPLAQFAILKHTSA